MSTASAHTRDGYALLSSELVANETLELQASGEDVSAILALLPLDRVTRVLDVGCGTGSLARSIARHGGDRIEVWGLDPMPEHVEHARRLAAVEGLDHVRFVADDVFHPPAAFCGSFDLVLEKYVLMSMLPQTMAHRFVAAMQTCVRPSGSIALIEADINFGADRHPPAPEPLATVLPRIVDYYRRHELIEWRCGIRLYEHLREAGLTRIRVRVADGRVIQGGEPRALVEHGNTDVEQLIAPCVAELGLSDRIDEIARQWRDYLDAEGHFAYHPIFVGTGAVL